MTKYLLNITLVAAAAARLHLSSALKDSIPPLKVVDDFLTQEEINYFLNFEIDTETGESSFYGAATMPNDILNRLPRNQEDLEGNCVGTLSSDEISAVIMTKMITNTSHFHKDMLTGIGGVIGCDPPTPEDTDIHDDVGIIFLNTNENAYFNRGDAQVSAVAGTLVAFNGGLGHNTVVNEGNVRIAGPFHLKTMQYVYECGDFSDDSDSSSIVICSDNSSEGDQCTCNDPGEATCVSANDGTPCESIVGPDRNLEAAEKASARLDALKRKKETESRQLQPTTDCLNTGPGVCRMNPKSTKKAKGDDKSTKKAKKEKGI
jgi:hypothetical protein